MEKELTITPSQYFDYLKNAKNTITSKSLKDSFELFIKLAEKYKKIGQTESLKKLCFLAEVLQKEEKLIDLGITTFVYKDTVEDYIENVADQTVKIIELSRYMREIPDELVNTIEETSKLFDEFYVLFTDYTGKAERKVEKERRDKDPILFGVFKENGYISDRFYFLGDWIDEYCDLTLDKMIDQYKNKKSVSPVHETKIPTTSEELIEILKIYVPEKEKKENVFIGQTLPVPSFKISDEKPKESFFSKVRNIFKK